MTWGANAGFFLLFFFSMQGFEQNDRSDLLFKIIPLDGGLRQGYWETRAEAGKPLERLG